MNKTEDWFVYMLLCDQITFYIGITNNLVGRIKRHKKQESFFTKKFSDLKLIYYEKYEDKYEAAIREKQLKGWSKAKKQMLIDGKLGRNERTEHAEALIG